MTQAITRYFHLNWNVPINFSKPTRQITHIMHVVAVETFAVIKYVIPYAFSWWIEEKFSKKLISLPLPQTIEKARFNAKLFLYAPFNWQKNQSYTPILLLHGDHSHPYTLHHLAQVASKTHSGPIFSLYIPNLHHDSDFNEQTAFIDTVISTIENVIRDNGGIFKGILAAGHSKGAMLLVARQFYSDEPSKILRTFAVAGPLKNEENCFTDPLKSIFENITQKIKQYTERKFYQIIPKNDWTCSYKAMAVRPDENCYFVPGMHVSGLYSRKTRKLFKKFLAPVT